MKIDRECASSQHFSFRACPPRRLAPDHARSVSSPVNLGHPPVVVSINPKSFVDRAGSLSESFAEVSMRKLVPIPPESLKRLKRDDLKEFGYQFVSVKLKDGRVFAQAVASEGCLIQVKGFREIPFVETDIESVDADGEPWNFRRRAVRTRTPPRK